MSLVRLTHRYKEIGLMRLHRHKVKEIAEKYHMHHWSVYRILKDPLVKNHNNMLFLKMVDMCVERQLEAFASAR